MERGEGVKGVREGECFFGYRGNRDAVLWSLLFSERGCEPPLPEIPPCAEESGIAAGGCTPPPIKQVTWRTAVEVALSESSRTTLATPPVRG